MTFFFYDPDEDLRRPSDDMIAFVTFAQPDGWA